jgi:hypothetical protein
MLRNQTNVSDGLELFNKVGRTELHPDSHVESDRDEQGALWNCAPTNAATKKPTERAKSRSMTQRMTGDMGARRKELPNGIPFIEV